MSVDQKKTFPLIHPNISILNCKLGSVLDQTVWVAPSKRVHGAHVQMVYVLYQFHIPIKRFCQAVVIQPVVTEVGRLFPRHIVAAERDLREEEWVSVIELKRERERQRVRV